MARQTGAGAIKPGEVDSDLLTVKLCFAVDSSGSMGNSIAKVFANIEQLFKKNSQLQKSNFFLVKFSDQHEIYMCNFAKKSYTKLSSVVAKNKAKEETGDLKQVFTTHYGAGTDFNGKLVAELEELVRQKYNVILLTDIDILDPENKSNFFKLFSKAKRQVYIIADTKETYHAMLASMGSISQNISYID